MRIHFSIVSTLIAATLMAGPVSAAPFGGAISTNLPAQAQSGDNSLVIQVQHRRGGGRHWHGGGGGGGDGGAVAAGVIGGVILGTIIASEAQRQQAVSYCARRFRSYDPGSMTYVA
jgi:hypothetical protein